jgi:hypothetical protein
MFSRLYFCVTSINLVQLSGNDMIQKKGYFVCIGMTVLCADAFSQSNHSNNDHVRDDSHLRPIPACFCVASLKVRVAMRNKKTISGDVARFAKHGKRTLPLIYIGLNIYYQVSQGKVIPVPNEWR